MTKQEGLTLRREEHRRVGFKSGAVRWYVVHTATGLGATRNGHPFKRKRDALAFIAELSPLWDWSNTSTEAMQRDPEFMARARDITWRYYRQEYPDT